MNQNVIHSVQRKNNSFMPNSNQNILQIKKLHREIVGSCGDSIKKGTLIGKILTSVKNTSKHGEWGVFVKKNCPFSIRTETNYIVIYKNKDLIDANNIKDLNSAYKFLANPRNYDRHNKRELTKSRRKEFANQNIIFTNPGSYVNQVLCGDNIKIMKQMLKNGMAGKYSAACTSPHYNAQFIYGNSFDDNKPYEEYLDEIIRPFYLYPQLLRPGGRVIYVIGSMVKNKTRNQGQDYNYPLVADLIHKVKETVPELLLLNNIIWDKSGRKDPLNQEYGTFSDPKRPQTRSCHEHILVWSNKQFDLENIEGFLPDITPDEFKEWAWSVWKVAPYSRPNNPHPCSFPPKLIERVLKFYSYPNDLILDPYAGVSTTAQVCKKVNRRYTMIEQNPNYCDESVKLLKSA